MGARAKALAGEHHARLHELMALNGGPSFEFSEGISLFVGCDTQEEIDDLPEKLSAARPARSRA